MHGRGRDFHARFTNRNAGIDGFQNSERFQVAPEKLGKLIEQLSTLPAGQLPPIRSTECGIGGFNGFVDLRIVGSTDLSNLGIVERVRYAERGLSCALDPLSVDE